MAYISFDRSIIEIHFFSFMEKFITKMACNSKHNVICGGTSIFDIKTNYNSYSISIYFEKNPHYKYLELEGKK